MMLPCCKRERNGLSATDAYESGVSDTVDIGAPARFTRTSSRKCECLLSTHSCRSKEPNADLRARLTSGSVLGRSVKAKQNPFVMAYREHGGSFGPSCVTARLDFTGKRCWFLSQRYAA